MAKYEAAVPMSTTDNNKPKINKTGITEGTNHNEGVIAPLVFTILIAILCYGLADRIYM